MSNNAIVKFNNITKTYHDLTAVNNLNLEIHKGEILGFIGPNGAGKTTTMKMLGGLLKPTSGHIEVSLENGDFMNIREAPFEIYKRFGFLIDIPAFYGNVTPEHILRYYCRLLGVPKQDIEKHIDFALEIVGMTKWKNKEIREFSKGMTQRLGLAQAIVHDPDVAVLDEPQTGLDPAARIQVRNIMKKLKDLGKTIFLSSHILSELSELCDRIALINHGELIAVDKLVNLEQKMTKQELTVELLEPINGMQVAKQIQDISQRIEPYGEKDGNIPVVYDDTMPGFHIFYDGKPESRKEIHDILSKEMGLSIISFSKIRTSRLEDVYMELVGSEEEQPKQNNHQKRRK